MGLLILAIVLRTKATAALASVLCMKWMWAVYWLGCSTSKQKVLGLNPNVPNLPVNILEEVHPPYLRLDNMCLNSSM